MSVELEYENIIKATHSCHRYKVYGADADILAFAFSSKSQLEKLDTNSDSQKFIEYGFSMGILITSLKVALSIVLKEQKSSAEDKDFVRLDEIKDELNVSTPIDNIKAIIREVHSIFVHNDIFPPENS